MNFINFSWIRKNFHDLLFFRDRKMVPEVLIRLMETDMDMIFSKWFLCCFLETLPLEVRDLI